MAVLHRVDAIERSGRPYRDLWQSDLRREIQIMRENAEASPRQAATASIFTRLFRRRANDDRAVRRLAG